MGWGEDRKIIQIFWKEQRTGCTSQAPHSHVIRQLVLVFFRICSRFVFRNKTLSSQSPICSPRAIYPPSAVPNAAHIRPSMFSTALRAGALFTLGRNDTSHTVLT